LPRIIVKFLFAFAACLYLSGSHLAFLQLVAWSGMLVSYSAETGFADGLRDTFSGEKPCSMCKAISAVRNHEDSREKKVPAIPSGMQKLWTEMLASAEGFQVRCVPLERLEIGLAPPGGVIGSAKDRPPVPPPRSPV
jgi:hypothetical protein